MPPSSYSLSNSIGIHRFIHEQPLSYFNPAGCLVPRFYLIFESFSCMTRFIYVSPKSSHVIDLPTQAADRSILLPIRFHVLSI